MPLLVVFLILFLGTSGLGQVASEPSDQVWEVGDRQWNLEEERRFEKWVDENVTDDFCIRYRLPTDCADLVYAVRWIYARMAHLPAGATTYDRKWIGHWSPDWRHLPTHLQWDKDKRFRAFLLDMLSRTWTGTLPFDTYPIRITADSVTPGTVFFVKESHAGLIGHLSLDGSHPHPLLTWESALPVKVRRLAMGYFFSPSPERKARSGLVKFRWPVFENGQWRYLPLEEHPFYSEEQYDPAFHDGYRDYVRAVAGRLEPNGYPPMERLLKTMRTTAAFLQERVPLVLEGFRRCHTKRCRDNSAPWETYQTIDRDRMIVSMVDYLSEIVESNGLNREFVRWMMETYRIEISPKRFITLYDVYRNALWLSHDPNDTIEARWGLKKCEMILAQVRATKNSIAFIEKTYRKRSPRFADFSIRQQRQFLERLNAEWTKSACERTSPAPAQKTKRRSQSVPHPLGRKSPYVSPPTSVPG